ncbi:MAG: hypothetical protein U9N35_04895 [Euryarchaeota archaeon]|nr:hypothetical protein [Euryarchaeota archaeon]
MKFLLFREIKNALRSSKLSKILILYLYIGIPLFAGFLRAFVSKDWNSGANIVVLLVFLWIGASSGNFKRDRKLGLVELFLTIPKSLNEIILSKFLASLPIAVLFVLADLGVYQLVSYYYRETFASISPVVILCGLALMFSCVLVSLSAWMDNITLRGISAIMGILAFVVSFGLIFIEISVKEIFILIILPYLLVGTLNWIAARDREKVCG